MRGDQAQARAHEGRRPDRDVTVMSEPGKGTVFTVHLAGNSIKVAMVPTETCDPMSGLGLVSRVTPVQTAKRNCTRDEGGPFEFGNQVLISNHRKLLSPKATVVNVAEASGI